MRSTPISATDPVPAPRPDAVPADALPAAPPALEIEGLTVEARGRRGTARVVDGVGLTVRRGEIVGLIGESGSGKTMTARAAMGMLPRGVAIAAGGIRLGGRAVAGLPETEWRKLRGDRVAMIPQDAMRALNPVLRVDAQVGEPYVLHRASPWRAARARAAALLEAVHLRDPAARAREYPHQFSGGMQQRAMIAMGLALEPDLLIADEPTTALDVTVQAQVLRLLREIRDSRGTAILFITHDLGVVAELCDRVYVMYAGRIVEQGPVRRLFARPGHPYTRALLGATPSVRGGASLEAIPGQIPSPYDLPPGCRFADRCPYRFEPCGVDPPFFAVDPGHDARCWLWSPDRPTPGLPDLPGRAGDAPAPDASAAPPHG